MTRPVATVWTRLLSFVLSLTVLLLAVAPALATVPEAPAPTIASDKADYAPGELVTLTGANWQAGESVHVFVNDDLGSTWSRNVDVLADGAGAIVDQFSLPSWFVATYSVVATGALSGVATASFTDGSVRVKAIGTASAPAPVDWTLYNTTNCTGATASSGSISAQTTGNGTDIPSGATNSQSLRLTAGVVSGFDFSSWVNGSFSSTTSNPTCLTGTIGTQNTVVNYIAAPSALNTSTTTSNAAATAASSSTG